LWRESALCRRVLGVGARQLLPETTQQTRPRSLAVVLEALVKQGSKVARRPPVLPQTVCGSSTPTVILQEPSSLNRRAPCLAVIVAIHAALTARVTLVAFIALL
jgi:hypothetical protein